MYLSVNNLKGGRHFCPDLGYDRTRDPYEKFHLNRCLTCQIGRHMKIPIYHLSSDLASQAAISFEKIEMTNRPPGVPAPLIILVSFPE